MLAHYVIPAFEKLRSEDSFMFEVSLGVVKSKALATMLRPSKWGGGGEKGNKVK